MEKKSWHLFTSFLFSGRSSSLGGGGCASFGLGGGVGSSSSLSKRFWSNSTDSVVITLWSWSFLHNHQMIVLQNLIRIATLFSIKSNVCYPKVKKCFANAHTCQAGRGCSWAAPTVLCSWDPTITHESEGRSPASGKGRASQRGSLLIFLS